MIWKVKTQGIIRSNALINKETAYIGSWDGFLYAIQTGNGSIQWKFNTYAVIQSTPVLFNDLLIIGSRSARIFAIDKNNATEKWQFNYWGSWVESTPVIYNQMLVVGSSDLRKVLAINPINGQPIWQTRVSGYSWAVPAIHNQHLYIGSVENTVEKDKRGFFYGMDLKSGKIDLKIPSSVINGNSLNGFYATPAFQNEKAIVGALDGYLYCFKL